MYSLQKRADHVIATIPCSVVEYVHYSRAIEEKKYCVGAIEVHDSLKKKGFPPFPPSTSHLRTAYLIISIFLHDTCTLMLDVSRVGKRMSKAHVKEKS